jgi:hypothetical protein
VRGALSRDFLNHEKFRRPFPVQTSEILNTITTYEYILMFDGEPMTPAPPELVLTLALAMRTSL